MPNQHFTRYPGDAFDDAIKVGVLSDDRSSNDYAGHFMYMYSSEKGDHFKHTATRQYIVNQNVLTA